MSAPSTAPPPAAPVRVLRLPGAVTVEIYDDWRIPAGILQAWTSILERDYGDMAIFLRDGWFRETWSRVQAPGAQLSVFVVEGEGDVWGIFLCWMSVNRLGKILSVGALTKGPYYDWIVTAGKRAEAIAAFFEAVWRLGSPAVTTVIESLPAASPNRSAIEIALRQRNAPFALSRIPFAPLIDLRATSWEGYYAALHPKLRNNLRKGRKRAEQVGVLSFEAVRRPDSLEALLAEMFEVEFQSWKGVQGTAIKCDERSERFYTAVAAWAMARGDLAIFTLRLAGRMIAFDLCLVSGRTVFALKTGFDQAMAARFSPGNLMRSQLIEYLYRTGEFDRYDFLGLCLPWKHEWTPLSNTLTWMEAYPPTMIGRMVYLWKRGWKRTLRKSARFMALAGRIRKWLRPERPVSPPGA